MQEPLSAYPLALSSYNYVEQEFFASGTAYALRAGTTPSNGRWSITPTSSAPYRTRILVRRPAEASAFNGIVVVEWMNVTEGEAAPDWEFLNPMLMRDGYAYVGVSAQDIAVNGGAPAFGGAATSASLGLVKAEPARYGTLRHPGDQYALDLFAQIGASLRSGAPSSAVCVPATLWPPVSRSRPSTSQRLPTHSSPSRIPSTACSSTAGPGGRRP